MTAKGTHLNPEQMAGVLDSISDGVFTVNDRWEITSFNRAAERITGIPADEAIGRRCCDVFRASVCESECALRQTLETGEPIVNKAVKETMNIGHPLILPSVAGQTAIVA